MLIFNEIQQNFSCRLKAKCSPTWRVPQMCLPVDSSHRDGNCWGGGGACCRQTRSRKDMVKGKSATTASPTVSAL